MNKIIAEIEKSGLPYEEMVQLKSLIVDHGYVGAINYLKPLNWENPNRNQYLADKHRKILESNLSISPFPVV